ncbi:MAG: bifunctional oligoribonuclease/PAP phosphatase NrnA [Bacteroidales bacterium]|nr:bifunctional oligoribonuclease/PAP phosphatase NrnA [Bacteroidales bacterium]
MLTKVIAQANIDHVEKWFERADKIVIVTHVSPDGDAIGSSLGLLHFLETQDKNVNIIVPNAFPDFLRWMSGAKDIIRYDKYAEFADKLINEADVICCLDFNALSRIDNMADAVAHSPARKMMIDHHLNPEDFCRIVISHPEISSTSELVFRLICRLGYFEDITKEGAECIYTGMMTDTGGFTYNSNSREIYYIISELLSKGIDKDEIYRKVYNTYSEGRLRLMGYVLYEKMQVFPQFCSALICLSRKEQGKFQYVKGDTEGFVNIPLSIKNVVFSVFLREDTEKDMIKVSLRSVGTFPCNKVAAEFFNGGGHLNASGGEFYGTMEEAIELYKQALVKYEDLLQAKK